MEYALPTAPGPLTQLGRALVADSLKLRRTAVLWLALGGGALPVLLNLLIFYFKGQYIIKPGENPWPQYISMSWQTASVLLGFFLVLLSGLVVNLENRGGWRQLLAQPVSRSSVFLSKLLLLLGLNAVAQLIYVGLLLAAGVLLGAVRPALGFQHNTIDLLPMLRMLGHTYLATLGILGIQYALALAFRGFVGPLAVGIAGIVSALTLLRWEHIDLVPYAAPNVVLRLLEFKSGFTVAAALSSAEWYSLGWFALAVLAGYVLLLRRPVTD
ncbi:ABC transporter permease [Hymenobacter actinosclerus]|uniref:ABC-2 family transporter protein n=1 Tax=Hymenobacter actinosclerus TaxID=82805 RepID=A0A1H9ZST3_9BACT|nr:ABC transporter permease [Hymenobacter actinosclerus]SES84294.1 hypothetical protein SAMN04487998_0441 [Hymenobacter actinosclerus]